MPWTETTRRDYDRRFLHYAGDVSGEEWEIIEPFMPPPNAVGKPRKVDLRTIWNAIQYIGHTGCQWLSLRLCPHRQTLGRRANIRMARALPASCQRPGEIYSLIRKLGLYRFNPHDLKTSGKRKS